MAELLVRRSGSVVVEVELAPTPTCPLAVYYAVAGDEVLVAAEPVPDAIRRYLGGAEFTWRALAPREARCPASL